jgi:alpha-mannosidase
MVANRGLPEVEVISQDGGTEIALTLLRCIGWLSRDDFPERKGHAGPGMATPGAQMPGTWAFDYAMIPFNAEQKVAACQQAYAFGAPMRAVATDVHPGNLPYQGAFLDVEPQSFVMSAVKATEDGRGWLARGYNLSDQTVQVRMSTIQPFDSAERVNLAEAPVEDGTLAGQQTITTEVKGREIATVAFRMK